MSQRRNRICTPRRGVTVVEFALTFPLLLVLVIGLIEFARLSTLRHAADNAAYEAARHVIVPGANVDEAIAQANDLLARAGVRNASISVNPTVISESTQSVTVQVTLPLRGNSWLPPKLTANRMVVRDTTLRTERVAMVQGQAVTQPIPTPAPAPSPSTSGSTSGIVTSGIVTSGGSTSGGSTIGGSPAGGSSTGGGTSTGGSTSTGGRTWGGGWTGGSGGRTFGGGTRSSGGRTFGGGGATYSGFGGGTNSVSGGSSTGGGGTATGSGGASTATGGSTTTGGSTATGGGGAVAL